MALTLPPDPAADSYITVADADAYFSGRPDGSFWTGATTSQKEWALRTGSSLLDGLDWLGSRASSPEDNALSWPRSGVVVDGYTLPSDAVPDAVGDSVCEQALHMLRGGGIAADTAPLSELKVGPIGLKYAVKETSGDGRPLFALPALRLVSKLVARSSGGIRLVRG